MYFEEDGKKSEYFICKKKFLHIICTEYLASVLEITTSA